jgi:hypothetical protein
VFRSTLQIDRQRHLCTEEVTGRALGSEKVQRHMVPVPRQNSEFQFAFGSADPPDAPDQRPFIAQPPQSRLVAAVGQLEAKRTLADPADERAPCTDPPRRIEEHHRVCALKPKIERAVVVAVDDPLVSAEQSPLLLAPLLLRWLNPARFPKVDVEMDEGEESLSR